MLAHILAVLVGTGSVGLYIAAFFFPEIHRKHDFIWSGVGFFYALALWIYARQITGGILVGQTASVALLGWFAWQTLKLRRQLVPTNQQTPIPTTTQIQQQLGLKPIGGKQSQPTVKVSTNPKSSVPTTPPRKPATPTSPLSDAITVPQKRQSASPNVTPVPSDPVVPSVLNQAAQPTDRSTAPNQTDLPVDKESPTQPMGTLPVNPEQDEAWIELTVKPSSPPPKPLGQPVKPPTTNSTPLPTDTDLPDV